MGNYLTRTELIASAGDTVAVLAGDQAEAANQALVNQAIDDCEAEVDAYLAGNYETPVNPVPRALQSQVRKLVLWQLLSRHGFEPGSADESIYKDYQAAIKFLEALRDGKSKLGVVAEDGTTQPAAPIQAVHPAAALPVGWRGKMPG